MSSVLYAVVIFFRFILERILDLICLVLFCASFVAIWRVPALMMEIKCKNIWEWRAFCAYAFAAALGDIVTLPVLIIVLCSYRTFGYCVSVQYAHFEKNFCWVEVRLLAWHQFMRLFLDIPFVLMMVFIHVCFWRIPFFWMDMGEEFRRNGCTLWGAGATSYNMMDPFSSKYRELIGHHALNALFELLCLPMFLFVLFFGYRVPGLIAYWCDPVHNSKDRKVALVKACGNQLVDIPFLLLGLLTCVFLIRAKYLGEDLRAATSTKQRRELAALHFVLTLRDLLVLLPFAVVLLSVYRGFLAVRTLIAKTSRWADPTPKLIIVSAAFEAPVGRPTGLVLRMQCRKTPEFELTASTPVRAFIRNPDFWGAVKRSHGSTAAAVGETMMPLSLSPRYFKPETVRSGASSVELVFDFDVSQKTLSLLREGSKVNAASLVQVEYGDHEGTLVVMRAEVGKAFENCVVQEDVITNADLVGKRLFDVMFEVVLIQFAFLLLDIIALVFFVLMHLIPPRVYRVYSQGCEGPARKTARRVVQNLELGIDLIKRSPAITHLTVESIDRDVRKSQDNNNARYYEGSSNRVAAFSSDTTDFDVEFARPINKVISDLESSNQLEAAGACHRAAESIRDVLVQLIGSTCSTHPEINIMAPQLIIGLGAAGNEADPGGLVRMESFVPPPAYDLSPQGSTRFPEPSATAGEPVTPNNAPVGPCIAPADVERVVAATTREHIAVIQSHVVKAKDAYRQLPWCGGREGWPGFRTVVFREVAQTILDFLGLLAFVLLVCTVYRIYPLLWSLANRRANEDIRVICLRNLAEIAIDLLYLLKFIAVLIGIRGIFSMPSDLVSFLCIRPTFAVARQVIDHHLYLLLADLVYLLSMCFAWDAIRLVVATVVFGVFAPGVLFETAFVEWEDDYIAGGPSARYDTARRAQIASKNHCRAFWILLLSMFGVFGIPCLCTYYIGKDHPGTVPIVYFVILGAVSVLGILAAFGHQDPRIVSLRRSIVRAIKPTWQNALPFAGMLLEGMLLMAAMFAVTTESTWGQYSAGERIRDVSRYLFLDFGQNWAINGLPFGVYFTVVVMLVHFVIAAMPIVCDHMLHWRSGEKLVQSTAWITSLQVLGQYCLLIVSRNVALMVTCTTDTGRLVANTQVVCYQDNHLHLTTLMLMLYAYYLPTAVMRSSTFDESACAALDVAYTQLYRLLVNLGSAFGVVLATLLYQTPSAGVALVFAACLWNLWWSAIYGSYVNKDEGTFVTVDNVKRYRTAMYAVLAISGILLIITAATEASVLWAAYASGALVIVAWVSTAIRNVIAERDWPREGIEEIALKLREAEADLAQRRALNTRWHHQRSRWDRKVDSATRASTLALAALELERHSYIALLPPGFFANRPKWVADTKELISACDEETDINVNYELDSRRWDYMISCCDCGCCSHYDRDTEWTVEPPESAKLQKLLLSVTALRNAVRDGGTLEPLNPVVGPFFGLPVEDPAASNPPNNDAGHAQFLALAVPNNDAGHARFVTLQTEPSL